MWLKDPKNNKKSATLTFFTIAFSVALIKLLLAGLSYKGLIIGDFTGSDFATVVGSIGTIYGFRKYTDSKKGNE